MGPRGHGLHCTEKHLRVLTWGLSRKADPGREKSKAGEWRRYGKTADVFPLSLSAAKSSPCGVEQSGEARLAPHRRTDDVSRLLLAKQAKAIKNSVSLFYNMQSTSPFVPVCVVTPVFCLCLPPQPHQCLFCVCGVLCVGECVRTAQSVTSEWIWI